MKNYNLVIIEDKEHIPFLNFTEQAFYDKLWEWTYEDDLWDYIDENNDLIEDEFDTVLYDFIEQNMFHKLEDDCVDCFAFVNTDDGIKEYQVDDTLVEFVKSKIKEHYD